jgi:hypothetical protein
VINGTLGNDGIDGQAGNDVIFGGDGIDGMAGVQGNDLIFGGLGSDNIFGNSDNDTLIPGPDETDVIQISNGGDGNDTFIVLVGETINCHEIDGGPDFDVMHLIGFGPHVADFPYGATTPIASNSQIMINDPIAGGYIFVLVENGEDSLERITGLPSPIVSILDSAAAATFRGQNCIDNT